MTGPTGPTGGRPARLELSGLLRITNSRTVQVAGHVLERQAPGRWELRCGHCLAVVATPVEPPGLGPRAGLVVDGALVLPAVPGWPEVSLAWGLVPADCRPVPARRIPSGRRTTARAVFRRGLRTVAAQPVLLPGGLWLAVAPVAARRVTTYAFGLRSRGRVAAPSRPACL